MTIEKQPFVRYRLDDSGKPDIFTIRLNDQERQQLNECKLLIQQPKDSTAVKTLMEIGANVVLHDRAVRVFIGTIFRNLKNNQRSGVPMASPDSMTNVTLEKPVQVTQPDAGG